jgi:hypothetical protein
MKKGEISALGGKNKKGNVAVIAIIVVIVAITAGVVGYLFAKRAQAPAQPVTTNQPTVQTQQAQQSTQLVDETANWQTYSNDGISFKYPDSWFIEEDPSIGRIYIKNIKNAVNKGNMPSDFQAVWISTSTQENSLQAETNVKNGKPDGREITGAVSAASINSNGVVINTYEYGTAGGPTLQAFWVDNNGKKYYATNSTEVGLVNQQNMVANLKKILSTFKFTDATADETANWQTYSNAKYDYEITFPADWGKLDEKTTTENYLTLSNKVENKRSAWVIITILENDNFKTVAKWKKDQLSIDAKVSDQIIFGENGADSIENPSTQAPGNLVKYVVKNGIGYQFKILFMNDSDTILGEKILTTFKFTN